MADDPMNGAQILLKALGDQARILSLQDGGATLLLLDLAPRPLAAERRLDAQCGEPLLILLGLLLRPPKRRVGVHPRLLLSSAQPLGAALHAQ